MGRKGENHPCRQKKRTFRGNQHTGESDVSYSSASAAKIKRRNSRVEVSMSKDHGYAFINFYAVFSMLSNLVICRKCHGDIKFEASEYRGLGFKLVLKCKCDIDESIPSCPFIDRAYEINRRLVFCLRMLGVGFEGLKLFCGLMDLSCTISRNLYYGCLDNIYTAAEAIYEKVLSYAVEEEIENNENENPMHLTVSGDGTWKKRGFSSLFGVSTLIGKYSKKVVDTLVKSSFCQTCNVWKKELSGFELENWLENHEAECTKNHNGSSGKMEVDAILAMFQRSERKHNVKYTTYIGDGDSKTFKAILDAKPYEDVLVIKKECIGHVEKRMGRRLREVKKKVKGIGGHGVGKLTGKVINDLTTYYGLAIRRNPDSPVQMKNEILATFYHKSSTDENPQHHFCPPGPNSWCKWRKAEASGNLQSYTHEPPLAQEVLDAIKPIYDDLTNEDLMERCSGANTQNNNESLNSLIWTFAPKYLHSGKHTVDIAVYLAVCIFNEGFEAIVQIMQTMGIIIGSDTHTYMCSRDEARIARSELRTSLTSKEAKIAKQQMDATLRELFEQEEGPQYGAGIAD